MKQIRATNLTTNRNLTLTLTLTAMNGFYLFTHRFWPFRNIAVHLGNR